MSGQTRDIAMLEAGPGRDARSWVRDHVADIRGRVATHGAVLVRGLPIGDRAAAIAALRAVIGRGMTEREGFAPRDVYGDGLHSSSHWSPDQPMCMHHELSYLTTVPGLLAFACVTPAASGGITALADGGAVLHDLPPDLVEGFERHGWRLTRSYNPHVGMPWQSAFGTEDRSAVERYCEEHDIEVVWQADGTLRTAQTRAAVLTHPGTGERCWFNQVAFLNEWTMEPEVRGFLVEELGPTSLPFNTFRGDGAALDRSTVDHVNEVYERHAIREPWRRGDLLVIDNIRMAHSREPFIGPREIVVGMGEPTPVRGLSRS